MKNSDYAHTYVLEPGEWSPEEIFGLRNALRMTQQEMADALMTNQNKIWKWECGREEPEPIYLRLLDCLNHDEAMFLEYEPR